MWDDEARYAVIRGRDARYDGQFITAVLSTGIYCRPSCPARTPARDRVRFYPTAAAAQRAGFRSCRRCFPDDAPGSPRWRVGEDIASRAMRLIEDGMVEREGAAGLARSLGYTERHLTRVLTAELGAGPQALAIAHRLHHARILLEDTTLPVAEVAFAAGFGSVRQFNDAARAAWDLTPTQVRGRSRRSPREPGGATRLTLRLRHRAPADLPRALAFLGARAVDGLETWDGIAYGRTMRLPGGAAHVTLRPGPGHAVAELALEDVRDLAAAVARCRRLLDLDADPEAVDQALSGHAALAPLVAATPGLRVPGAVDPFEMAVRAVVGQQVSVAGARRTLATLVQRWGEATGVDGQASSLFPSPAVLAEVDPASGLLPQARWRAITTVARALAAGTLDLSPGADRAEARRALLAIPGIGPWTAEYLAMRALGDPDAFPAGDLVLRRAVPDAARASQAWRPWRAYAAMHLWTAAAVPALPTAAHDTL